MHDILGKLAALNESTAPLNEEAKSKSQQKFMGMVHAAQKGEKPASKEVAKAAKGMSKKAATDYAETKHKGLPEKVDEEIHDYDIPTKLRKDRGYPDLEADDVMPDREVPELDDDQKRKIKTSMPAAMRKERGIKLDIKDVKGPGDKPWAQKMMKSVRDDFPGNEYSDMKESKSKLKESKYYADDAQLDSILRRFPHEVKNLEKNGELDYDGPLYDALFDHYYHSGEMPYNVAKGREGSPYEWVLDKTQSYLAGDDLDLDTDFDQEIDTDIDLDSDSEYMDTGANDGRSLDELARLAGISESKTDESYDYGCSSVVPSSGQEDSLNVSSSYSSNGNKSITVTAQGSAAEEIAKLLKSCGLAGGSDEGDSCDADCSDPSHDHGHSMEYDSDTSEYYSDDDSGAMTVRVAEEYSNEPDEQVHSVDSIIQQGNDLNRPKKQYASKPKLGDNPMAEDDCDEPTMKGSFKKAYESIIKRSSKGKQ